MFKKKKEPIMVIDDKGNITATRPFVFFCGCGSLRRSMNCVLDGLGLTDIDYVKISASRFAKKYIEQKGLKEKEPRLGKASYAVLHLPKTNQVLNIAGGNCEDNKELARKLLKEEENA